MDLQQHGLVETEVATGRPGVKLFVVQQAEARSSRPEPRQDLALDSDPVYFKSFPGLKTAFDLPLECFPAFENMLNANPTLVPAVNIMMQGDIAVSTAKQYRPVIIQFQKFCARNSTAFPYFTPESVLKFAAEAYMEKRPLGFFRIVAPALTLLECVSDRQDTGLTTLVRNSLEALQRDLASKKPAVRKAKEYGFPVLNQLMRAEILPHIQQPYGINVYHFRSVFRATVMYFTFCRFADFDKLTDADFEDCGTFIKITFRTRKNDQMGDNSEHVVPERTDCAVCPAKLIRQYFWRFGLKFQGSGLPVNFRLQKVAGRFQRAPGHLSRSNATKYSRQLLHKHGYNSATFTEKSFKVGGVTGLLNTGEPLENVQVLGGWRSLQTPLYYRNNSLDFKLGVAANIPVATDMNSAAMRVIRSQP
jgi:hypothetical protein